MSKLRDKLKKKDWRVITGVFLFVTLILSMIYSVVKIITSPTGSSQEHQILRSDYVLMLLQCCLGLVVMTLPMVLQRRFSLRIPGAMTILYFIFLYCAIYLGEVRSFYYRIPNWDIILHTFSGGMLGGFGFLLVSALNSSEKTQVELSPFFVSLFAFSFALCVGALWEIYEFAGDSLFGLNMQKFRLADGTPLVGQAALADTMEDMIVDAIGALVIVVIGYIDMKRRKTKDQ